MPGSLWASEAFPLGLSWSLKPQHISLQTVPKIKGIALLLVPNVLRLALGKIHHAHPLTASFCSSPLPQIKY